MADLVGPLLAATDDRSPTEDGISVETGVALFDELTDGQKLAAMHHIAGALFDSGVAPPERNAVFEAAIAAVFASILDTIGIETGLQSMQLPVRDQTAWRRLVIDAWFHRKRLDDGLEGPWTENDIPTPDAMEMDEWDFHLECLLDAILFDRDFQMAAGFLDQSPDSADAARSVLGVGESYFATPAPDILTATQRRQIESNLKALLAPHLQIDPP
jgi:hypothetical protein